MTDLTKQEEERLRRALDLLGDEAGRTEEADKTAANHRQRARRVVLAGTLATAVSLCVGVLVIAPGDRTDPAAPDDQSDTVQAQSIVESIACSSLIAEGEVLTVRAAPQPRRVVITFAVQDWIKPAEGDKKLDLNLFDPAEIAADEAFKPGQHVLLIVPERREQEPAVISSDRISVARPKIERALPEAARTECPPIWQTDSTAIPPSLPPQRVRARTISEMVRSRRMPEMRDGQRAGRSVGSLAS